jgi:hypothetical protein
MNDLKSNLSKGKFYRTLHSIDIEVEQGEIFYREKYNDIMNYFKMILTHNEDSLLYDYSKIISPKGLLLININQNSDIHDFLKLVSKNYFLDVIELNNEEIFFNYTQFLEDFILIVQNILNKQNDATNSPPNNKNSLHKELNASINKIIIIYESQLDFKTHEPINLMEVFINSKLSESSFTDNKCFLIWITNKMSNIYRNSQKIFDIFDLFINIPPLDRGERESVLRHFSELYPKIVFDVDSIANYTKLWEVKDFKHLLKLGILKHFLKSELNQKSNEITDILIELIEAREFIPSIEFETLSGQGNIPEIQSVQIPNTNRFETMDIRAYENTMAYKKEIQEESISEFMLNQLYENAASKHYKELQIIIEKINKHEFLEDNDRSVIAKYPFILNENPNKALIALEKAKKKINRIKQIYKGS